MAISLKQLQQNYNQYVYSDNSSTHEYFNMGLFNEYTPNNASPRALKFNQIKQAPIVDKCDNYYLSIVRWNLQSNLPVLIPDIQIKPNNEAFTGFTDYQLALMYNIETTTQLDDTFGLVSAAGKNNLGVYKTGEFGSLKNINLNFPPDNSASVDYDNFNNGLDTSGNGSVYIISGGVIKVFDKVTSNVLLTKTPSAGASYKFLSTNKSTGDFYFGTVNNTDNTIFYTKGERTGANTWDFTGGSYLSPSNKSNVAGIVFVDNTLNELSNIISPPDTLYGLVNNNMYTVSNNEELTNSPNLISPIVYISAGFYFATASDNTTYYAPSPISPPSAMTQLNNNAIILNMYSNQADSGLYGLGLSGQYYQLNGSSAFGILPLNVWSQFGNWSINNTPTGIISLDSQDETNNVIAVGSDNNFYQSTYPIAPYEFGYLNYSTETETNLAALMGFGFTGSSSGSLSYITNPALPFNNTPTSSLNVAGVFQFNQNYYVLNGTTTLIVYNGLTNAVINTYTDLDTNMNGLYELPSTSSFAYSNFNNILNPTVVIRSSSDPTNIIQTFNLPSNASTVICELDATHIAVICGSSILIYVYGTANPINTINEDAIDITANKSDQVNGASKLFYLGYIDEVVWGNTLYSISFTDDTYSAVNGTPTQLFVCENGRYSTYIQCKPENGTISLLDFTPLGNEFYNDRKMNFLFQSANYASTNSYSIEFPFTTEIPYLIPNKPLLWMNSETVSTHQFTQITSNIELLSASVSRTNGNVYAIGKDDNKIYSGTIVSGSIIFNKIEYGGSYDYVSSIPKVGGPTLENRISQWDAVGEPSLTNNIDSSAIISTNPTPSSLYTDGTDIYAVYSNLDNTTYINKINPSGIVEILKNNLLNITLLNGLIGYDSNNNILLSNKILNVNSLSSINPDTLQIINNYVDPNSDYLTSSMLTFPFDYFETITSYAQVGDTTNLIFIPETINTNLEIILNYPRNKEELFNNPYFYIKYVDTFCRMINNAIKEAFASTAGTWAKLPYFQWDSIEGKIVYNQPTSTPVAPSVPAGVNWYVAVNQPLYNLLNTFRFKYYPSNSGNGLKYPESAECRYLLDTNILFDGTVQVSGEYSSYVQQISSVQTWTPIQSWVFSSTIIPIESQLTGQPQNLNNIDPTTQGNIYQQQAITKVLTDFIIPLNTGVEATNQNVFYTPAGEYRLVDLLGSASLNQLSLEIKWRDKYGVDHDMFIDAGGSANLLVLLRKKSYNSRMS
jgi:hypothetical protein